MHSHTFNERPPTLGKKFNQPSINDFPELSFKNASLLHVLNNTTAYVREVIQSIKLNNKHRYVVVDVKTHDIEVGKYPCIPGWHCDTVIDPKHPTKPDIHNIFVTGYASLTEFIGEPITLTIDVDSNHLLSNFRKQIDNINPKVISLPSCQVAQYGRFDFHRGSLGKGSEKRLLIRVSETDVVPPVNKPQIFGTY